MLSYINAFKYYFMTIIEIIHAIIYAVSHYIFSTTEKNIRNEIVLITGSGRGLGIIIILKEINLSYLCRSTNGCSLC